MYRFLATLILDGLMSKWGKKYEAMHKHDEDEEGSRVTLYDQLPQQFTRDQLRELIVKLDISTAERIFICKWKKSKLIHPAEGSKDVFVKNF